jgi:hypothetical protein
MLIKENHEPCTKIEDGERFFNFFYPPQVPEDDEDIDDDDDDDVEELESQMDEDYEIGCKSLVDVVQLVVHGLLARECLDLTLINQMFAF